MFSPTTTTVRMSPYAVPTFVSDEEFRARVAAYAAPREEDDTFPSGVTDLTSAAFHDMVIELARFASSWDAEHEAGLADARAMQAALGAFGDLPLSA